MSWFTCDDGTRYELFGEGGGAGARRRSSRCRCSARCRSCPSCARAATTGDPIVVAHPDDEVAQAFRAIAERLDVELAPKRIYRTELKIN